MGRGRIAASGVVAVLAALTFAPGAGASGCDPVDLSACLLPVAQRLLHAAGPAARPPGGGSTSRRGTCRATRSGVPIAAADYDAADGFSPARPIMTRFPGSTATPRWPGPARCRRPTWPATATRAPPIVVIDAQTGRRQPIWAELDHAATTTRPATCSSTPRSTSPSATATSWPCAACRGAGGRALGRAAASGLSATRLPERAAAIAAPAGQMERRSSARRAGPGSRAGTSTSPGTSPSPARATSPSGCSRSATTPSPGLGRPATSPTCKVEGRAPHVRASTRRRTSRRPRTANICRARHGRRSTVPCYLDKPGCPPGSRFRSAPRACPRSSRATSTTGAASSATSRAGAARGRPRAPLLYGHGLLGTADEVNAGNVGRRWRPSTTRARARPTGRACPATTSPTRCGDPRSTSRTSRRWPTALQQGILNFLFLGPR